MARQALIDRVRKTLAGEARVEEKRMFGGVAFMVDGKMCVTVGDERIMCRIDPALHEQALKKKGCRAMVMNGREYKGYVHVDQAALAGEKELGAWVRMALEYNPKAKAAKKRPARVKAR